MYHLFKLVAAPMLILTCSAGAAVAGPVVDGSYLAPNGQRVLRQSIDIDAPIDSVWEALRRDREMVFQSS
jgi:hypothetical protein